MLFDKFLLELLIIFYYSVVYYRYGVVLAAVGMGVQVRRSSVGCPSGMADAYMAGHMVVSYEIFQVFYASDVLLYLQTAVSYDCYACRIVSSVFKFFKSVYDDFLCIIIFSDVSYYTAHIILLL